MGLSNRKSAVKNTSTVVSAAPKTRPAQPGTSISNCSLTPKVSSTRYDVTAVIGRGSYGSVSEAYDKNMGVVVAIKQMKRVFSDLTDCKRILRELAILTRLDHPNVVRIHDIIVPTDIDSFNEVCLVLELCDTDLKKLVKTDVTLTMLHINTLLSSLLQGLQYIHDCNIIHRDLKPANCLANQDCMVKICDFGLARAMDADLLDLQSLQNTPRSDEDVSDTFNTGSYGQEAKNSNRTEKKRVMTKHVVTRWYRAPELVVLEDKYTTAIDVWSVGCIFAELLQMLNPHVHPCDRTPLFPGNSCYPLSPGRNKSGRRMHTRGQLDQLEVIFDVIGTPTDEDIIDISSVGARRDLHDFVKRPGTGVREHLPDAGEREIEFLSQMLQFSPQRRITVKAALQNQAMVEVMRPAVNAASASQIVLGFEKEPVLSQFILRGYFDQEFKRFQQSRV